MARRLGLVLASPGLRVNGYVGLLARLRAEGRPQLARAVARRLQAHGVFISPSAVVPASTKLPHPVGIVVGDGVRLGERVVLYQNVTLGGARVGDAQEGRYPVVGDDTVLFAGAVVAGAVTIGRGCVIGANSVVTSDVPDGATAVGAPARVVARSTEAASA
jgi:serine O-acetyltransferase